MHSVCRKAAVLEKISALKLSLVVVIVAVAAVGTGRCQRNDDSGYERSDQQASH